MIEHRDLDGAKRRLTQWWNGEQRDRVTWSIVARRSEARFEPPEEPRARDVEDWWTNPDIRLARWERGFAWSEYLGEAMPYFDTQIGPGSLGLFLGCRPVFDHGTVWYEPCIDDLVTGPDLRWDPGNKWFRAHMDLIGAGLERAQSRYYVGIPDLIEGLDTLAALHNNARLLVDLLDSPAEVHRYLEQVTDLYFQAFDPMYDLVKDDQGGCMFSAFQTWAPGRYAKLQCDVSAAIGPRHFAEFVAPYLEAQCRRLDYAMYHLDGVCAVRHLDALLEIPGLQCIQWTPGAGEPGVDDPRWFDMYRRILKKKLLILIGVPLDRAREVVDAIGAPGLHLVTGGCSVDDGLTALEAAKGWG